MKLSEECFSYLCDIVSHCEFRTTVSSVIAGIVKEHMKTSGWRFGAVTPPSALPVVEPPPEPTPYPPPTVQRQDETSVGFGWMYRLAVCESDAERSDVCDAASLDGYVLNPIRPTPPEAPWITSRLCSLLKEDKWQEAFDLVPSGEPRAQLLASMVDGGHVAAAKALIASKPTPPAPVVLKSIADDARAMVGVFLAEGPDMERRRAIGEAADRGEWSVARQLCSTGSERSAVEALREERE